MKRNTCRVAIATLTIACSLLIGLPEAFAYKIIVDVNQINSSEADAIHNNNVWYYTDGIWAFKDSTTLSDTQWTNLISDLNGSTKFITEDTFAYEQSNCFSTTSNIFFRVGLYQTVHQAFVYIEPGQNPNLASPADTVLHYDSGNSFDQIYTAWVRVNSVPLIVHTRAYYDNAPTDLRKTYMGYALASSYVGGAALEWNPETYVTPGNASSGMAANNAVDRLCIMDFIHDTINAGKDCYLLMPPNGANGDYTQTVMDTWGYPATRAAALSMTDPANSSQSILHSSKLHFVLALYLRDSGNEVGFLTGDNSTGYSNSILSAEASLGAARIFGTY